MSLLENVIGVFALVWFVDYLIKKYTKSGKIEINKEGNSKETIESLTETILTQQMQINELRNRITKLEKGKE